VSEDLTNFYVTPHFLFCILAFAGRGAHVLGGFKPEGQRRTNTSQLSRVSITRRFLREEKAAVAPNGETDKFLLSSCFLKWRLG